MNVRINPYVGPRAFESGETLYGRERELRQLQSLLIAERIVLLHSPSGAGKTSLIQAGLVPALREREFNVLPAVRVNLEPPSDLPLPEGFNRYLYSLLVSLEEPLRPRERLPLDELLAISLEDYLRQRPRRPEDPPSDLLIFDQFEEILTTAPADRDGKLAFFNQLGEALRNPDRWALFAMREDYLGALSPYLRPIPGQLEQRYRLDLLGPEAALQAIQNPAREKGVDFTDGAARKLVDDLRVIQVQQPDGSFTRESGPHIEPVQLQVVCYRLWEATPGQNSITENDLGAIGTVDEALAGYFAATVAEVVEETGVSETNLREWFQYKLITPEGLRGQVLRGRETSEGLDNRAIELLEDAHLIRAEKRAGATWYELSHDRLVEPVRKNNNDWLGQHMNVLQVRANLWIQQNRSDSLLLRGPELAKMSQIIEESRLNNAEKEYLENSRKAERVAQKDKRNFQIIALLAICASVALIISIFFGLQSQNRATDAQISALTAQYAITQAEAQKATALAAQATADFKEKEAKKQANISRAGELAAQAELLITEDLQKSLLFAIESFYVLDNVRTQGALLDTANASPHLLKFLDAQNDGLTTVVFSPDGKSLAFGSINSNITLWDVATHEPIGQPLVGHSDYINSIVFSPDGEILASGSDDTTIIIWDVATHKPVGQPLEHTDPVNSIAFSPDGKTLASGSTDGKIILWDTKTGQTINQLFVDNAPGIKCVSFSPNGKILASGNTDGKIVLWDTATYKTVGPPLVGHTYWVSSIAFSVDGNTLVSGSYDENIILWDLATHQPVGQPFIGHKGWVNSVAYSPDGKIIASGGTDGRIILWDINTHKQIGQPLIGHTNWVTSIAFSSDNKTLVSCSYDKTLILWNINNHQIIGQELAIHSGEVSKVSFSPDGKTLAVGSIGKVIFWDMITHNPKSQPPIEVMDRVSSIAFSPDGNTIAINNIDTIILWDVVKQALIGQPLRGHKEQITSIAFSPDGKLLASGSIDKTIILWDLATQTIIGQPLTDGVGEITTLVFNPDGKTILSGDNKGALILWDLKTFQYIHRLSSGHTSQVKSVAFSPDGKTFASSGIDGTFILWDMETFPPIGQLFVGHSEPVNSFAFTPDGNTVASGSMDGKIILWDRASHQPIGQPLTGHISQIFSIAFSPNDKVLASGDVNGSIIIWNLDPHSWIAQSCQRIGRNFTREEWKLYFPGEPYHETCTKGQMRWPTPIPVYIAFPTQMQSPTEKPAMIATPILEPSFTPQKTMFQSISPGKEDMVAFHKRNDIWGMNLDGSGLRQLTFNGLLKTNLQWSPDGDGVVYKEDKTVKYTALADGQTTTLVAFPEAGYFDAFQISPSGKWVAISLGQQLYVVPYNLEALSEAQKAKDLLAMENLCIHYKGKPVEQIRWSKDEKKLAIEYLKLFQDTNHDTIGVLDLGNCGQTAPVLLDEFPLDKFAFSPEIVSFNWDGEDIFALNNNWRNDGFGDLYVYNTEMQFYRQIAPIENTCCYRDATFSSDGKYLFFAFQDIRLGSESVTQFYYVPFDINSGFEFASPIPLPPGFLDPQEAPHPILRPVKP